MIGQKVKPSTNQAAQKGEILPRKKKNRLPPKNKAKNCIIDPESSLPGSRISCGPSPSDIPSRFYIDRPVKDHQLNMKLKELTPENPATQTTQGIQDFIKQVSNFIEKKNPSKVIPRVKTFCPDPARSGNALKNQRLRGELKLSQFSKNSEHKRYKNFRDKSETMENAKRTSASTQLLKKGAQRGAPPSEAGKVDETKKGGKFSGGAANNKKELKVKLSLKVINSKGNVQNWDHMESQSSPPANRPNHRIRRPWRSEIPLRKTRVDMSKSPKPVSLLLQKPLKEVESAISIDFYSKKLFTPIEELSLSSEKQSYNAQASSEKLNRLGKKSTSRTMKKDVLVEANNEFKLDRCFKSANIPIFSEHSFSDVPEQKLCAPKMSNILDLDKVRTSSFTVLRNSREALCRLESLHQQNVSTKENVFGDRVGTSKLKMLSAKPSFNSLKAKGSKKNLSARLSSKGNKPALKISTRKSKRDVEGSVRKSQKTKSKTAEICLATPLEVQRDEESTKDGSTNRKLVEPNSESRCTILGCRTGDLKEFAPKEDLSIPKGPKIRLDEVEREPKSPRNTNKKVTRHLDNGGIDEIRSLRDVELPPPPCTPEYVVAELIAIDNSSPDGRQTDEDERSSSKTVTLTRAVVDEVSSLSSEDSQILSPSQKTTSKDCGKTGFAVKGTPLKVGKDEPPEKPEESEPKKNKLHIKIDLITTPEDSDCEENENIQSFDWLYPSDNYSEGQPPQEGASNDLENKKEEEVKNEAAPEMILKESTGEQEKRVVVAGGPTQKSHRSSLLLRGQLQYKVPGANLKGVRKKIRSDAGDRQLSSSSGFFKSVSLQNKMKLDTKLRSGLTKAYLREEKRDLFDDTSAIKLKRRNSEPISFRGYIWKRADSVTPRGHKASVSSMTSSLKHLNTDDIDDFVFWEAVPQKMTSCWEMSLYHFKRPWSVLSCSVFEDNRQSNTPGLILENLRNGAYLIPGRSSLNASERANCPKDNPFDVEPSIAQKNIDIRNWLAALNFPTPPSTSVDAISEGNFSTQSPVDAQNLNKEQQVNSKRKKVLPSLRFSEENTEKKADGKESKYKKSDKWDASEVEGFVDLIRRKSEGFVTNEQFLNSHHPNVTVNLCLYSKTPEERPAQEEESDISFSAEPKALGREEDSPQALVENSGWLEPRQDEKAVENLSVEKAKDLGVVVTAEHQGFHWGRALKRELLPTFPSDVNIWKYLFLFTLFVISVHYCFLNNSTGRS